MWYDDDDDDDDERLSKTHQGAKDTNENLDKELEPQVLGQDDETDALDQDKHMLIHASRDDTSTHGTSNQETDVSHTRFRGTGAQKIAGEQTVQNDGLAQRGILDAEDRRVGMDEVISRVSVMGNDRLVMELVQAARYAAVLCMYVCMYICMCCVICIIITCNYLS